MKCNDCAKRLGETFSHRMQCKYCTAGLDALLSDESGNSSNHSIIIEEDEEKLQNKTEDYDSLIIEYGYDNYDDY